MIILSLKTDKPQAEIGLYDNNQKLAYQTWQAHRELAETLHVKIEALLAAHNKNLHDLQGIICYQGPGSFTGLRIGLSVANALAYGLSIPVVATHDSDWLKTGILRMTNHDFDTLALPVYGSSAHVTQPKK